MGKTRRRRRRQGESRANEEERLAANAETIRPGKRVSVGTVRDGDSRRRRDDDEERGGAKKRRTRREIAVRDESEL